MSSEEPSEKEAFRKDAENFAKTAEKVHTLLGNDIDHPEEWKIGQDLNTYRDKIMLLNQVRH